MLFQFVVYFKSHFNSISGDVGPPGPPGKQFIVYSVRAFAKDSIVSIRTD